MAVSLRVAGFRFSKLDSHELAAETAAFKFQLRPGRCRYYLQRWPSRKAMNRERERVRELTPRGRCHQDVRGVIAELNPVLRGWGQYFQTGNAADHFIDVDDYVVKRLRSLRVKRAGRNLRAGQTQRWDRDYFESLGLHRLRGTLPHLGKPPGNGRAA
jgi:hypothetical protein